MKKIALFLLICMYTLSSFGVGISQFYCCGKLKTTTLSFIHTGSNKCSNKKDMLGCCKTTFKSLQVKDSHVAAASVNNPVKPIVDEYLKFSTPSISLGTIAIPATSYGSNAPPLLSNLPIYIFNCTYLI